MKQGKKVEFVLWNKDGEAVLIGRSLDVSAALEYIRNNVPKEQQGIYGNSEYDETYFRTSSLCFIKHIYTGEYIECDDTLENYIPATWIYPRYWKI